MGCPELWFDWPIWVELIDSKWQQCLQGTHTIVPVISRSIWPPQIDFEAFLNLHLAFPRYTVFGQLALQKVQRSGPLAMIRFHVALPSNSFSFEVSVFENETNKLQQPHKTAETRGTVSSGLLAAWGLKMVAHDS